MLVFTARDEVLLLHLREGILAAPFVAWAYYLIAAVCAAVFFSRKRVPRSPQTPPVSILKPVRGLDREGGENFASFCRLDYPEYEILFGVSDPNDPAIPAIEKIISEFPERPIRLFTGLGRVGHNDKASILAHLAREANHELLVISDSDTRAQEDYLRVMVAPFSDRAVGAVTCLYRGAGANSLADSLEAVGISSDFLPGVLLACQLGGIGFALGAAMATTRAQLAAIGGFEALSDFLMDDYELGRRIARQGCRVELLPYVVSMVLPSESLRGYWGRQLRWAVGVRNSRPWSHLGLLITQGLPLSLLAAAVSRSGPETWAYITGYVATRYAMAWTAGVWGLRDPVLRRKFWLVPVRDAVGFCAWVASFLQRRITWRGNAFHVRKGRLAPVVR
ncbi:MAG: bacteriohopanetetrol glucosamine biosynthesis glycosyltransferase HpnI [Terriglobia bacterium]